MMRMQKHQWLLICQAVNFMLKIHDNCIKLMKSFQRLWRYCNFLAGFEKSLNFSRRKCHNTFEATIRVRKCYSTGLHTNPTCWYVPYSKIESSAKNWTVPFPVSQKPPHKTHLSVSHLLYLSILKTQVHSTWNHIHASWISFPFITQHLFHHFTFWKSIINFIL